MRRTSITILILLIILGIGWYFAWTFIAGKVQEQADLELMRLEEQGTVIACDERSVVGFPLAVKMSCSGADIVDQKSGIVAAVDGFEAGALVYAPRTISADIRSPLRMQLAGAPDELDAVWQTAKAKIRLEGEDFSAGSFTIDDLVLAMGENQLAIERVVGDVRKALTAGSTLIGVTADSAEIGERTGLSVPITLDTRAQINVPPEALAALEQIVRQSGLRIRNISADIEGPDMRVRAIGDLEVDPAGYLTGKLALQIFDVEALPTALERLPDAYRSIAGAAITGALAMGKATTFEGETARELQVTIDRGSVRSGFIPIGQIPPLFR